MKGTTPRRAAAAAAAVLAMSVTLGGCSMTPETQKQIGTAACAATEAQIASLRAGGAAGRALAGIIRDTTEDERVREVATLVASSKGDKEDMAFLADLVEKRCG